MKNIHRFVLGASVGLLAAASFALTASAGTTAPTKMANIFVQGYADATASQTFAVTSYADLAAAAISYTPRNDPAEVNAPGTPARLSRAHITWSADVSKATGTTGSCAIYVNGAIVAGTERFSHFSAGRNSIGGFYDVTLVGATTQTVKLQCHSADTSVFTVNTGNIYVEEWSY